MQNPNLPALYQSGGLIAGREEKALTKQLRGLQTSTALELAQVQAITEVEIAKAEALETASHVVMASTAAVIQDRRFRLEHQPEGAAAFDLAAETAIHAIVRRIERLDRRLG